MPTSRHDNFMIIFSSTFIFDYLENYLMNWRIVAVPVTLIPIILIAVQFDIKIEDILAIGIFPFIGAIAAMMIKLGLQGIKFAYITRKYLGNTDSFLKLVGVRVGSEFIKFTTPMFIGAEFIVIYYLKKKGIALSKATWIALVDIVTEVLAAGLLSMLAGIIALLNGAYVVGIVILATSISITSLWMIMFFLSSKHTFQVPNILETIVKKLGKEKGIKLLIKQILGWKKHVP